MLPKIYDFINICIQFFYLFKRLQLNFCITVLTVIKYIRKTFDLKKKCICYCTSIYSPEVRNLFQLIPQFFDSWNWIFFPFCPHFDKVVSNLVSMALDVISRALWTVETELATYKMESVSNVIPAGQGQCV